MHCLSIANITLGAWMRGANFRSFISSTIVNERAASDAKSTFLANISHEMRTPLTSIIGASDLILHNGHEAMNMESIVMIKQSGEQVLSIVNDLLDVSSIDRGKFKLHRTHFNLYDVVTQIANLYRKQKLPSVEFIKKIKFAEDFIVHGDFHRLSQVIHKLLSNALKFTKEGEISITAQVGKIEGNLAEVEFVIKDTGIGISKSVQQGLFKPFFQADKSSTRQFGGIGLGLTICHELVIAMGGNIKCLSTEGVGTTVKFTVQLELSSQGAIRDRELNSSTSSPREDFPTTWYDTHASKSLAVSSESKESRDNPSILVVEDNLFNQLLLKKILNQISSDVDTADNGEEALSKTVVKDYDLIFMDIQMPIQDGIEATKAIRKTNTGVRIVGLTANCDDQSRLRAMKAGMNSLLFKPVRVDDLHNIVNKTAAVYRKSI